MKKVTILSTLIFASILTLVFLSSNTTHAEQVECPDAEVKVISRDSDGGIVQNIAWQLWTQIENADGDPLPARMVGSSNTGVAAVSSIFFNPSNEEDGVAYAVKIYDVNDRVGEFWEYDKSISCGGFLQIEKKMSGLQVILRDKDGNALKDRRFEVYEQLSDVQNDPIFGERISSGLSTESVGVKNLYIAPGSYIVKIPAIDNKFDYIKYNVNITNENEIDFDFTLSNVSVSVRDGEGNLLPESFFNVYLQAEDIDDEFILGEYVGRYGTGVTGITDIFLPTDNYAFRFDGENGQFHYLWNQSIDEEDSSKIDYKLSNVSVVIRDALNNLLHDHSFDIYRQGEDIDGAEILGDHLGRYNTGAAGSVSVFLPNDTYAFRFNGSGNQFYYLWNQEIENAENTNISYQLATLKTVVSGVDGQSLDGIRVRVYRQDVTANDEKILGDKLTEVTTDVNGSAILYFAADTYALEIVGPDNKTYTLWDVVVDTAELTEVNYKLSGIQVTLKNGNDELVTDKKVEIFKQLTDAKGEPILGDLVGSKSTENTGRVLFYYPSGKYAIKVKGASNLEYIILGQDIADQKVDKIDLILSSLRLVSRDPDGNLVKDVRVKVARQDEDFEGNPILGSTLADVNTSSTGFVDVYLPANKYVLITDSETRFDVQVANNSLTTVEVTKTGSLTNIESIKESNPESISSSNTTVDSGVVSDAEEALRERIRRLEYQLSELERLVVDTEKRLLQAIDTSLTGRLKGRILLQVEEAGEAWYLDPSTEKRYYLKDGDSAYVALGAFGLGVTNENLNKIPIGIEQRADLKDSDGDGLEDRLEESLGTDPDAADSDGDGYSDGTEVLSDYDPLGSGVISRDYTFADSLKGKILLQVESAGEAWYVNPADGKRYYMKDGNLAYQIMRFQSLGISNDDLRKIAVGDFSQ